MPDGATPTARRAKIRAVVLVGFMGAGKSSVGRALAVRLGGAFEDLDERIEKREGRTVAEIFRESGEGEFRRIEHEGLKEALAEIGEEREKILALGGGAFIENRNLKMIQNSGVPTIFLDASVEELWRRCCAQASREGMARPLLSDRAGFSGLYNERRPRYLKASIRHGTDGKTIDQIAAELAAIFTSSAREPRAARRSRRKSGEKP